MDVFINFNLQQIEAINDEFLPYMRRLVDGDLQNYIADTKDWLKAVIVESCYENIVSSVELQKEKFTRMKSGTVQMELEQPDAIVFYMLLRDMPENKNFTWLNDLKRYIVSHIENQVWTG